MGFATHFFKYYLELLHACGCYINNARYCKLDWSVYFADAGALFTCLGCLLSWCRCIVYMLGLFTFLMPVHCLHNWFVYLSDVGALFTWLVCLLPHVCALFTWLVCLPPSCRCIVVMDSTTLWPVYGPRHLRQVWKASCMTLQVC